MVTRRGFLQSVAAAFAMPAVASVASCYGVKQFEFAPWVDVHASRFDLSKPFDWGDMTIATDGRKLISVSKLASVEIDGTRALPNVEHLPWDCFSGGGWKRFQCQRKKSEIKACGTSCENCLGLGWLGDVKYGKFDPRKGPSNFVNDFVFEQFFDNDIDVYSDEDMRKHLDATNGWETDGWHSDRYCEVCSASGWNEDGQVCVVDGINYDSGFIASIQRFGDFEIRQEEYATSDSKTHQLLLFRGHDFRGMMMPRAF